MVRFTADGKFCLTAGHDRTVRLWNPTRLDPAHADDNAGAGGGAGGGASNPVDSAPRALPIQSYPDGHTHPVSAVGVDASSATLLSASDRTLVITDLITRRALRRLHGHAGRINSVCCGGGGGEGGADVLFSASYDGTVRAWDGRSRSRDPIQVLSDAKDSVTAFSVAGSGGAAEVVAASVDGSVRTYDLRMGRLTKDDLGDPVTGAALTGDDRCLAASCLDGTVRLLERDTGDILQTYSGGHKAGNYMLDCDVAADDACVTSGSEDGLVVLYDLVGGKVKRRLEGHDRAVCSVAARPRQGREGGGRRDHSFVDVIVSAGYDGRAVVWGNPSDTSLWEK